jgi:hypothetical protein
VADFWAWFQGEMPGLLTELGQGVETDMNNVLVRGESAGKIVVLIAETGKFNILLGGYLAIQSVMLHPEIRFKAVIAAYPVLAVASPFFAEDFGKDKLIMGRPAPPTSILKDFLASIKPGEYVTEDAKLTRSKLMIGIINQGRYFEFLSRETKSKEEEMLLQPIKNIDRLQKYPGKVPFFWLYHGTEDSGVPVEGTAEFERRYRELLPQGKAKFTYELGEHGFDRSLSADEGWMKEGLNDVKNYWGKTRNVKGYL